MRSGGVSNKGSLAVQSDSSPPWPKPMQVVIKYKILVTLAGNLRINVEPFLKMAWRDCFWGGRYFEAFKVQIW